MLRSSFNPFVPRNGHTLIVGIVARISGCESQTEVSLDDQIDHVKAYLHELYPGEIEFRTIAITKAKGERIDRPELAKIEEEIKKEELDVLTRIMHRF